MDIFWLPLLCYLFFSKRTNQWTRRWVSHGLLISHKILMYPTVKTSIKVDDLQREEPDSNPRPYDRISGTITIRPLTLDFIFTNFNDIRSLSGCLFLSPKNWSRQPDSVCLSGVCLSGVCFAWCLFCLFLLKTVSLLPVFGEPYLWLTVGCAWIHGSTIWLY